MQFFTKSDDNTPEINEIIDQINSYKQIYEDKQKNINSYINHLHYIGKPINKKSLYLKNKDRDVYKRLYNTYVNLYNEKLKNI